ncbi:MAG: hypothetical protein K6G91_11735 [Kiritimatiellae bacterium]|nr:hypothetical protein [Kiritimatiellia bacterium]
MKALAILLLLPLAAVAARVAVAPMEISPYLDTEVSTNVAINTWRSDARQVDLRLQLDGSPSNNLEVAFGRDANRNGVLDLGEVDAVYGWRGGRYFVENVREWERFESVSAAAGQCGVCSFRLRNDRNVTPKSFSAVCDGAAAFPELATVPPPAWLYRREWDCMRVTRRGVGTPSGWIRCDIEYAFFRIR